MFSRRAAIRLTTLILALAAFATGCQPELKTPLTTPSEPTAAASPPAPALPEGHPSWAIVRDEPSGVGFTVPCWWAVSLPGEEGLIRSITVANFDQAYFEANSERGEWKDGAPPEGVLKFDLTLITLDDPGVTNEDFARQFMESDIQTVVSTEEVILERHDALKVQLRSTVNDASSTAYLMRPSPGQVVLFSINPHAFLGKNDIRILLASMVFDASEAVIIPIVPPERPLPGVAPFCVQ